MTTRIGQSPSNVLSVSLLNHQAKQLLETSFARVMVTGELSNMARPSSGHWYFTLKDDRAQVRCAMFRSKIARLGQSFKEGDQVVLKANLSLYEARGDYQLIVEHMSLAGVGELQAAFEALKRKLYQEGLFHPDLKQPLPEYPSRVAIITSTTGAAVQDIISIMKRRAPHVEVLIYPALVQGKDAASDLYRALDTAIHHDWADVIILGRGGGSIEDLWGFNDEALARLVAQSAIPIVSAVGHEVDFSITDFVADVRAATPSAAAELVTHHHVQLNEQLFAYQQAFTRFIYQQLDTHRQSLTFTAKRLKHPKRVLQEASQRLDRLEMALLKQQKKHLEELKNRLIATSTAMSTIDTKRWLSWHNEKINQLQERLFKAYHRIQLSKKRQLEHHVGMLQALSPLNTLQRGYSITLDENKAPLMQLEHGTPPKTVYTQLQNGYLHCEVISEHKGTALPALKTFKH